MDSKQSLEFIRTLIARSENEPEVKALLKKATLMNKMAQTFADFDDGHLENLYEMTVNRAGVMMFLQTLKAMKTKGKAPKGVLVQTHPKHLGDMKKFFPSVIPFAITSAEEVTTLWNGDVENKSKTNVAGLYNDLRSLKKHLQQLGVQAPFEIKPTGKTELTIIYTEDPAESRLMFDEMMEDVKTLAEAMAEEGKQIELKDRLDQELQDAELDLEVEQNTLEVKEAEEDEKSRQVTRYYYSIGDGGRESARRLREDKEVAEEYGRLDDELRAIRQEMRTIETEIGNLELKVLELKERLRGIRVNPNRKEIWETLDLDLNGTITEQQLGALIELTGKRKLRGNLPYKKVVTVKISCVIKSSSSGYKEGNFKNLEDFIKLSVF